MKEIMWKIIYKTRKTGVNVNIVKHKLFYQTESPIFRDDCHDIKFYSIDAHWNSAGLSNVTLIAVSMVNSFL